MPPLAHVVLNNSLFSDELTQNQGVLCQSSHLMSWRESFQLFILKLPALLWACKCIQLLAKTHQSCPMQCKIYFQVSRYVKALEEITQIIQFWAVLQNWRYTPCMHCSKDIANSSREINCLSQTMFLCQNWKQCNISCWNRSLSFYNYHQKPSQNM